MEKLTVSQAASLFGVDKKTIQRWDESGKLPSMRDENNFRYYLREDVEAQALWLRLRLRERNHNRTLNLIRQKADQFARTRPLDSYTRPATDFPDMKKAYSALRKWESEHKAIQKEFAQLPSRFRPKIDVPDYEDSRVISLEMIKSLLDDPKGVVVQDEGEYIRFNPIIGDDNKWQEIDLDGQTNEEVAAIINVETSKARSGTWNQAIGA